jgi:hypothetical protein
MMNSGLRNSIEAVGPEEPSRFEHSLTKRCLSLAVKGEGELMRKQNLYIIVLAIVLSALVSTEALAATRSKHVSFDENLLVGGTMVKKGDYRVRFDNQSNRLLISRGKRIVAQAPASLEDQNAKEHFIYTTQASAGGQPNILTAVKVGKRLAVINLDNEGGNNPPSMSPTQ